MIGRIAGTLIAKAPPQIVIDVQGVGYEIDVPMSTFYGLPATGEKVSVYTHLTVREDAHLLYGFSTDQERAAFRQLLKISGIGPKVALSVLSGMSVSELGQTIAAQETARLVRIPGVGKKTAERLLLELKGKFGAESGVSVGATPAGASAGSDVLNALLALGYNEREAAMAMKTVPEGATVSDGIRLALRALAK